MDQREPPNDKIGEDMNALRAHDHRARSSTTKSWRHILGSNGDIRYVGTTTDMASGRTMEGQMNIRLTFTYPLKPSEL